MKYEVRKYTSKDTAVVDLQSFAREHCPSGSTIFRELVEVGWGDPDCEPDLEAGDGDTDNMESLLNSIEEYVLSAFDGDTQITAWLRAVPPETGCVFILLLCGEGVDEWADECGDMTSIYQLDEGAGLPFIVAFEHFIYEEHV